MSYIGQHTTNLTHKNQVGLYTNLIDSMMCNQTQIT